MLNPLHEVTRNISGENAIQSVELVVYSQKGHVTFIPKILFDDFKNMKYLWVEPKNKFKNLRSIRGLKGENLEAFVVEGNEIRKLGDHSFAWAKNLKIINLRQNKIEIILKMAFSGLTSLSNLYLQGNHIQHVYANTFHNLSALQLLDLANNSCMNRTISVQAIKHYNTIDDEIQDHCAYDESLQNLFNFSKVFESKIEAEINIMAKMNETVINQQNQIAQLDTEIKKISLNSIDTDYQRKVFEMNETVLNHQNKIAELQHETNKVFYSLFVIVICMLMFFVYAFVHLFKEKLCKRNNIYESTQTMTTIAGNLDI